MSEKLQYKIRDEPNIPLPGLVNAARRECMVDIFNKQAYWIRRKERETMQWCDMEQYYMVRNYVETILKYILGSRVTLQVDKRNYEDAGTFERMFWGLGALEEGCFSGLGLLEA